METNEDAIIFAGTFNGINTVSSTKSYKISLMVDETSKLEVLKMGVKFNLNDPLLVVVYRGDSETLKKLSYETDDLARKRLNKQMYAKISNISNNSGKHKDEIKKNLKNELIKNGHLNSNQSSKELTIKGLSFAISILSSWENEQKI
jgi:hypothetical protein